ncbi:MAG TPA: hypothetical protein PKD37_03010 [Oligoflexia bacterium]|nr:hypothetical protein [Oligoflexia bacterium]HMP26937.1 hypothetical protein [Oligoflexia bacterium]
MLIHKKEKFNANLTANLFFGTIILVGLFFFYFLCCSLIENQNFAFDTDEADHANAAYKIYFAFLNGGLLEFWEAIRDQAFYPPLFSIVSLPILLWLEPTVVSARAPSVLLWGASFVLMVLTARKIFTAKPLFGLIPLLFFLFSPLILSNAPLSMLETLGLFLTSLILYLSTLHRTLSFYVWGVVFFLLAMAKYSFAITIVPGALLALSLKEEAKKNLEDENCSKISFSVDYVGGVAFVFLLLLGSWLAVVDKSRVWHFVVGHPSYVSIFSWENFFYYFERIIDEYNSVTFSGALLLFLALSGGFFSRSVLYWRLAAFCSASAFGILFFSTTNEARHIMPAMPFIYMLAGLGAESLWCRFRKSRQLLILLLISALFLQAIKTIVEFKEIAKKELEGEDFFVDAQRKIIGFLKEPILVNGVTDSFSLEALRWFLSVSSGNGYKETKIDSYPFRTDKNKTAKIRGRNTIPAFIFSQIPLDLEKIVDKKYYQTFVSLRFKDRGISRKFLPDFQKFTSFVEACQDKRELVYPSLRVVICYPYQQMVAEDQPNKTNN